MNTIDINYWVALFILAAVLIIVFSKRKQKNDVPAGVPVEIKKFLASIANDKSITVKGWHENELHKILNDYSSNYEAYSSGNAKIIKQSAEQFKISFSEDIDSEMFLYLINYLAYPLNFKLKSVEVAGLATLNTVHDQSTQNNGIQKAIFYIPKHDVEHDVVYISTQQGANLKFNCGENSLIELNQTDFNDLVLEFKKQW